LRISLTRRSSAFSFNSHRFPWFAHQPADLVLSVVNTGPVVPANQVDLLFQPFQRHDADRTHRDGGLGLGLFIGQAIAAAQGATVLARPRPAGGLETSRGGTDTESVASPAVGCCP
jgi:signal transduction histidine kinase